MRVREIMTGEPVCVAPDTEVIEAAELMRRHGVGALPVCDERRLVGIVTDRDIVLRHVARGHHVQPVGSIMTPYPFAIGPDEPVERAKAIMLEHRVRRLPVTENGEIVGIISRADIARRARIERD
jgi:CBS domain-containing protein